MRHIALLAAATVGGCTPNPRSEMPAVIAAAVGEFASTTRLTAPCVEREVTPWRSPREVRRIDPPPPAGFAALLAPGVFRGGGGIRGDRIGRATIGTGADCLEVSGPLIAGDRAMAELHMPRIGWNRWLRRIDGRWHVVARTTSEYPI